ncbi:hypothetical protein N9L66_04615 [Porticoccaceae bacterium]|nr:hypothetical protein [Porticoccaceae bacterium]MDB2343131.1 hypothetical protein [Porticoccaceae bacterium]
MIMHHFIVSEKTLDAAIAAAKRIKANGTFKTSAAHQDSVIKKLGSIKAEYQSQSLDRADIAA